MMRSHWFRVLLSITPLLAACGPETTSFRTTDRADEAERAGPRAAAYDVQLAGQPIAQVHVWSSGGYVSISDEPMMHIGFEIHNTSSQPIVFDGDALELVVFDASFAALLPTRFMAIAPLGPAQIPIAPGKTVTLASYFLLPVRPRVVDTMQIRWSLRANDQPYVQITRFTRDDDFPILNYARVESPATKS
jgi:hypothetical protein